MSVKVDVIFFVILVYLLWFGRKVMIFFVIIILILKINIVIRICICVLIVFINIFGDVFYFDWENKWFVF